MNRRSTRIAAWTALVMTLVAVLIAAGHTWRTSPGPVKTAEKPQIALVLGMRHGDYWKTVYLGAEAAARERGASVRFLGPDDEEDMKGQVEAIRQALADGADALVLAPNDDAALAEAVDQASQQVPVITIDSRVKSAKVKSHIGTDNYAAGTKAAGALLDLLGPGPKRIGVVGFVQGTLKADQRERGLLDGLAGRADIQVAERVYSFSDQQLAAELTRRMLEKHGPLDGLVALNSIASVGAAETLLKAGLTGKVKLVAFDSTTRELELLQEGTIQATVVQNPFGMGYLGVMHALDVLSGGKAPSASMDTGSKVIRQDTMFSYENQKLLFPLLK
ncbi:substrate-binding domain-containing protein [Gorillibacterium sp. sgz5001074]|uniref:substrate-binding domain-containing protein n=1 Tax=Gorillibacterium sp. sgz5001074 TaxID=3446695 RepID=UPI003F66ECF0